MTRVTGPHPEQIAPLARGAPVRPVGGVQSLAAQERTHRPRSLTAVGLADDLPLVLEREPPPRRLRHDLDLRPTEGFLQAPSPLRSSSGSLGAPLTPRQVDPLIRELTHYRAMIVQKTQEVPT
jgi:hypothetical protein